MGHSTIDFSNWPLPELKRLFEKNLRAHDWYYAESDDFQIYYDGRRERTELEKMHVQLNCPFTLMQLRDVLYLRKSEAGMVIKQSEAIAKWFSDSSQPSFSYGQVEKIIANLGVDVKCGACMAIAFTGSAPGLSHTCENHE